MLYTLTGFRGGGKRTSGIQQMDGGTEVAEGRAGSDGKGPSLRPFDSV